MICALFALLFAVSVAQAEDDTAVWSSQFVTYKLHHESPRGVSLWLDLHERHTANGFLGIVRPAVGYDLSKGLAVWAGYGLIPSVPTDGELRIEHRLWQQATVAKSIDDVVLSGRVRLEERFVEDGDAMGLRLRTLARVGRPIASGYGVAASDELFVHLNDTSFSATGFDQNRLVIGPYYQTEKKTRFEVGYLNVVLHKPGDTRVLHGVQSSIVLPLGG